MFCPNCGKKLTDNSRFCGYCGTKIADGQPGCSQNENRSQENRPDNRPQEDLLSDRPQEDTGNTAQRPLRSAADEESTQNPTSDHTKAGPGRKGRRLLAAAAAAVVVVIVGAAAITGLSGSSKSDDSSAGTYADAAADEEETGQISWSYNEDTYTLTISGKGSMEDYESYYDTPWCNLAYSSLIVENGVTHIGNYAFSYYYLKQADLADTVESVGDYAFYNCESLSNDTLTLPSDCTIGDLAFYDCSIAADSEGFTILNDTLIWYDGDGADISVPDGVVSIGYGAFGSLGQMETITIPDSVAYINPKAFTDCNALSAIYVSENNPYYASIDGVLYTKDEKTLVYVPRYYAGSDGTYTIPDGVTAIGDFAFFDSSLTEITICADVSSIGEGALAGGCAVLNVADGNQSYFSSDGLVLSADGSTVVAASGGLESCTIPDGVTQISDYAFCSSQSFSEISLPDSLESIGTYAFAANYDLKKVELPDSVTDLGAFAFYDCEDLTDLQLSEGLTAIEAGTFLSCVGLTQISIPSGVVSIGMRAFYNSGLTSMELPDTLTSIGHNAFCWCEGLLQISFPESLTYIGAGAFLNSDVSDIYYAGTETDWSNVSIHTSDNDLFDNEEITWHYSSTGAED